MSHVSKKQITTKTMGTIKKNLLRAITRPHNNKSIIEELFTDTEYVMFAKRLAVIILISQGISCYRISKNLGVSISTVLRFQRDVRAGKFTILHTLIISQKKSDVQLLDLIEKILRAGMPTYNGKGRWAWLDKLKD